LVCDDLNTHVPEAFYRMFLPKRQGTYSAGWRYVIHKYGRWPNVAELELRP